jgi:hypothetical protein
MAMSIATGLSIQHTNIHITELLILIIIVVIVVAAAVLLGNQSPN